MANTNGRGRAFWERTIREYEQSEETQDTFARRRGFSAAALRYWRLRLRREQERAMGEGVRLVPVTITGSAVPDVVEIGLGELVVRVRPGTDTGYVAQLVGALRGQS